MPTPTPPTYSHRWHGDFPAPLWDAILLDSGGKPGAWIIAACEEKVARATKGPAAGKPTARRGGKGR